MSNTTKEQRPQDKPGLRFLGKLSYFKAPTYTDGGIEKIEVGLGKIHPQKKPEKTLYFMQSGVVEVFPALTQSVKTGRSDCFCKH